MHATRLTYRAVFATTLIALITAAGPGHAAETVVVHDPGGAGAALGIGLGDPAALDLKLWTSDVSGLDLGIGVDHFEDTLGIYGEYELGLIDVLFGHSTRGVFYLGIGGAVAVRSHHRETTVALVVPIGFDVRFRAPIDLFIEARPGIDLANHPAFGIGGQLGIRFIL